MESLILQNMIQDGMITELVKVHGDGKHFTAVVVSKLFINVNRLERQRLVFSTLQHVLANNTLHAITIKTFTPDEWNSVAQDRA